MDGTKELFKKIRGRDRASFDMLSQNYGWKLYSYIRKNTADRASADRIFSDTFQNFYDLLDGYEGDDPIEAMLFTCADKLVKNGAAASKPEVQSPMGQWEIGCEAGFSLPKVEAAEGATKKESLGMKFFYGICILLLVIGIFAALWIMLYMLMSMNLIPQMDLGYSWFNANVMNLF